MTPIWDSGSSTSTSDYFYISTSTTDSTSWQVPMNTISRVWTIRPPEANDLHVEGDISCPTFEKRMIAQMEEMISQRIDALLPLIVDAVRWPKPKESFTGVRCIICGAPARAGEGCDYCGR